MSQTYTDEDIHNFMIQQSDQLETYSETTEIYYHASSSPSAVRAIDVITPYKLDSEQANFVNKIIFDQPSDSEMDQSSNIPMDQGDQRQDEQDLGQDGQESETQQSPSPGPSQHNGDAASEYTTHTYETPTSNRHISATQYADRRMQVTRDRFQVQNPTMRFHSWIYGLHAYYNMGDDFYINVFAQVELEERRSRQNRPQAVQATVPVSNPNPVTSVVTTATAATPVATAANFIPTLTSYVPYRGPFYGGSYVPTFAQPVVRPTWAAVASAAPRPAVVPTTAVVRAPLVSAAGRGQSPPPPPPKPSAMQDQDNLQPSVKLRKLRVHTVATPPDGSSTEQLHGIMDDALSMTTADPTDPTWRPDLSIRGRMKRIKIKGKGQGKHSDKNTGKK